MRLTLFLIGVYRRFLTRYTPICPDAESCSAYAERVIQEHGLKIGLEMAVNKLKTCGKE